MLREWIELIRGLGAALLEVYRAEASELGSEVRTSSKHLLWAVALFLAAAAVGFWALAAGIYFLIQVLALWLPLWGASGVVLLALVLTLSTLAGVGVWKLRKWENPAEAFRRRLVEHRVWIDEHLLPAEEVPVEEVPVEEVPVESSAEECRETEP